MQLAKRVVKEGWSARETKEKVLRMKSSRVVSGNPVAKRLIKALENPIKLLDDQETTKLFIDTDMLAKDLDSSDRVVIIKTIEKTSKEMDKGKDILSGLKKSLLGIELAEFKQ